MRLYKSENHYQDWVDAINNGTEPICAVEVATIGNICNIAYGWGRPIEWNPEEEHFKGDTGANNRMGRKSRAFKKP